MINQKIYETANLWKPMVIPYPKAGTNFMDDMDMDMVKMDALYQRSRL